MIPKHQKVTTYSKAEDGSTKIESKSYYESLEQVVEEIEKHQLTTDDTIIKDVEKLLRLITHDKSPKLSITVTPRPTGGYKLTQRHVTIKKKF